MIKHLRRKRGTMLVAFVVLIPMAMLLYIALLSRIDAIYAGTSRMQRRAQARLLAESAFAILQDQAARGGGAKVEGSIAGVGRYALEGAGTTKAGSAGLRAVGFAESRNERASCAIECFREGKTVRPAAVRYQNARISVPRQAEKPQPKPKK